MIYRIKQFYQGLFAKIYDEDLDFLNKYLDEKEKKLFLSLRVSEQRHCLNIAYDIKNEFPEKEYLIKVALLHDIGKIGSNLNLINKSLIVIIMAINIPEKTLPPFLKKALDYKLNHPELGYLILKKLDLKENQLFLIRNHHNTINENNDLKTFQSFDNKY